MVVGDDVVAERAQAALHGVADDDRADVADVHRLRDVRRRVVDDDALTRAERAQPEVRVRHDLGGASPQPPVRDVQVHEAGAGDLEARGFLGEPRAERVDDHLRDVARLSAQRLRERQRARDLELAELGLGRAHDGQLAADGRVLAIARTHGVGGFGP